MTNTLGYANNLYQVQFEKVLNMVLLSKKNQPVNTVLLSNSVWCFVVASRFIVFDKALANLPSFPLF